jgi:AcrR family transcriptional regulator
MGIIFGQDSKLTTREKIFITAVKFFSDLGFSRVSMRDIAQEVGISAAAIYNHFPAKDSLLDAMYTFYTEQMGRHRPDVDALLAQCEDSPIADILGQADFRLDQEVQDTMNRIVSIAIDEARSDRRSADFIEQNILNLVDDILIPVLKRLIDLGRIEPLDLEGLRILFSNYTYAGAVRDYSLIPIPLKEWQHGMEMLFCFIKPTGN